MAEKEPSRCFRGECGCNSTTQQLMSDPKGTGLEESAYLGELLAGVFYGFAGYRMLRLAAQTREIPEWLLGLTFLLIAVSFVLYQVPLIIQTGISDALFYFAARVIYGVSAVTLALFTRVVFRQTETWALALVLGVAASLVVGVGFSALGGDWEGFSISNRWFWFEWVANTLPFGWICVEAFINYRSGRRRVRVGLLEPLVCNRFLLWMFVGLLQVSAFLLSLAQYAEYEATGVWSTWSDTTLAILEFATIGAIWMVFFPPVGYRRWINRAAAIPDPSTES